MVKYILDHVYIEKPKFAICSLTLPKNYLRMQLELVYKKKVQWKCGGNKIVQFAHIMIQKKKM